MVHKLAHVVLDQLVKAAAALEAWRIELYDLEWVCVARRDALVRRLDQVGDEHRVDAAHEPVALRARARRVQQAAVPLAADECGARDERT